jgi:hypothetical protein
VPADNERTSLEDLSIVLTESEQQTIYRALRDCLHILDRARTEADGDLSVEGRDRLLAIPSRVAAHWSGLRTANDADALATRLIHEALDELSEMPIKAIVDDALGLTLPHDR